MKAFQLFLPLLILAGCLGSSANAQTINVFSSIQTASSRASFFDSNQPVPLIDEWTGSYDLTVSGTTFGTSSLPNPGLNSSASGYIQATHTFSPNLWHLNGQASSTYNAGLGSATLDRTSQDQSTIGAAITFSVDQPFVLTLTAALNSSFSGPGPNSGFPANNAASVSLFVVAANGQFVNQYVTEWNTVLGSSGGSYTDSFNDAVFRVEFGASTDVFSNVPGAFGTQTSAYDLQLSVSPIPEPSGALLALLGGGWFLGLRRRRA